MIICILCIYLYIISISSFSLMEIAIFHLLLDKSKRLFCRFRVYRWLEPRTHWAVCGDHVHIMCPKKWGAFHGIYFLRSQNQGLINVPFWSFLGICFTTPSNICWRLYLSTIVGWCETLGAFTNSWSWTWLSRSTSPGRRRRCHQWFAPGGMNDEPFWAWWDSEGDVLILLSSSF